MNDRTFIDTNVLIYAHAVDAKARHEGCKILSEDLNAGQTIAGIENPFASPR